MRPAANQFERDDDAGERLANPGVGGSPVTITPNRRPTAAQTRAARAAGVGGTVPDDTFTVGEMDLNDDGKPDLIVHSTNHMNCGSAGCGGDVLMREGDHYSKKYIILPNFGESVTRLGAMHNGMHDLSFDGSTYVFKWDGKAYR